jgi:hypothetical protein
MIPLASLAGVDLARDCVGIARQLGERREVLRQGVQGVAQRVGHRVELDAGVEILGVLAEHHEVDAFLEVERIARIALAGAMADVELSLIHI